MQAILLSQKTMQRISKENKQNRTKSKTPIPKPQNTHQVLASE